MRYVARLPKEAKKVFFLSRGQVFICGDRLSVRPVSWLACASAETVMGPSSKLLAKSGSVRSARWFCCKGTVKEALIFPMK